MSVTHNLSAFVADPLSGQIITDEVIKDGTNETATGATNHADSCLTPEGTEPKILIMRSILHHRKSHPFHSGLMPSLSAAQ